MKKTRACVLVAAAVCLQSCSSITMVRTEELRLVQAHVDSLKAELSAGQKEQSDLLRAMRADLQARLGEIEQRIGALESSISESQNRLSNIDKKTQEIRQRWDEKVRADSISQTTKAAESENLLQVAVSDFNAGRFEIALAGFNDLMARFPDAPQIEAATYFSAECRYAQKNWEEALTAYIGYFKKYPQGDKRCATLYKMGLIYEKQNKAKSQQMVWDKLKAECSDSEEAKAAGKK